MSEECHPEPEWFKRYVAKCVKNGDILPIGANPVYYVKETITLPKVAESEVIEDE